MKIENIKFKAKIGNVWEYGYPIKCADGHISKESC